MNDLRIKDIYFVINKSQSVFRYYDETSKKGNR